MYIPSSNILAQRDRSLAECLRLWPTVHYRAAPGPHKQFADRIMQQAQRPDWEPGPAQLRFIRDLVSIYAPDDIALDPDLVPDMAEKTGWSRV